VRHSPVERRILLRTGLFLVPASSLWALLPLIATRRLGLGSSGYGLLLTALGIGAIGGAFLLRQARARLSANAMAAVASLLYAAVLVAVVLSHDLALSVLVLLPAGAAWTTFLSNVNAGLQLFLPMWVRARGLAVCQMVLFGAQAAGALLWGLAADVGGLTPAFLASAALLAAGAAGTCTRTARTRGRSSSCSRSRPGTSTSCSTGSGRPVPTLSSTTRPRRCPTRLRGSVITWPSACSSSGTRCPPQVRRRTDGNLARPRGVVAG
jgi:predicted MFS family arabinose efflux permease